MTIAKIGNYRLCTIHHLTKGELSLKEGIALEKTTDNGDSYYVICFFNYSTDKNEVIIENVGTRILDIESHEWESVKKLIALAYEIITINNIEEDD